MKEVEFISTIIDGVKHYYRENKRLSKHVNDLNDSNNENGKAWKSAKATICERDRHIKSLIVKQNDIIKAHDDILTKNKRLAGQYSLLEHDVVSANKTRDKALKANSELAKVNGDLDDLNKELIKDNEGLREELKIVDAHCRDCDIGYNKKMVVAEGK